MSEEGEKLALKIENGNFYWTKDKYNQVQEEVKSKSRLTSPSRSRRVSFLAGSQLVKRPLKVEPRTNPEEEAFDSHVLENNIHILKDINIKIAKGKLVGFLGEIGSGKSSLLNSLIGETKIHPQFRAKI